MKYQAPNTCADEGNNGPEPVRAAFETEREYPFMKEVLNVGVIGLGNRGSNLLENCILPQPGVRVLAVCDNYEDRREKGVQLVTAAGQPAPRAAADYREVLAMPEIDAVVIMASWESHLNLACDAMRAGKYTAVEVAGAYSVEDCWKLVRTHEETGVPCMMLENCCFGRDELMVLNMVRRGLFGEVVHCQGGYRHDLREEVSTGREMRHYRFRNYLYRNCENYPTHELGPIANVLDINRGNRMLTLVSVASKAAGLHEYLLREKGPDYDAAKMNFAQGDVVTTIIKCARGETICLTLDTTLPRAYSRGFHVQGTKGMYMEDNKSVFLDGNMDDLDVLLLVVSADIVSLEQSSLLLYHVDGLRMILYIQPVADIFAVSVYRKLLAVKGIVDDQRDQLLGELERAVIVGAVGDIGREMIGIHVCLHQHVRACLTCRVRTVGIVRRGLIEESIVIIGKRSVDLIRRYMQELFALLEAAVRKLPGCLGTV